MEAEEGADLCSPEGSWFHDPLPLSKGPELPAQLTVRLSENCPLSALTPTQSELPPLCISCPLLITPNPLQDSQPTSHPLDCTNPLPTINLPHNLWEPSKLINAIVTEPSQCNYCVIGL